MKPSPLRDTRAHAEVHRCEPHTAPSITVGRRGQAGCRPRRRRDGRHRTGTRVVSPDPIPRKRITRVKPTYSGSRGGRSFNCAYRCYREPSPPGHGCPAQALRLIAGPSLAREPHMENISGSYPPGPCWRPRAGIVCGRSRAATSPPDEIRVNPPDPEVCCPATRTPFSREWSTFPRNGAPSPRAPSVGTPGPPDRPAPRRVGTTLIVVPRTGPTPPGRHRGSTRPG